MSSGRTQDCGSTGAGGLREAGGLLGGGSGGQRGEGQPAASATSWIGHRARTELRRSTGRFLRLHARHRQSGAPPVVVGAWVRSRTSAAASSSPAASRGAALFTPAFLREALAAPAAARRRPLRAAAAARRQRPHAAGGLHQPPDRPRRAAGGRHRYPWHFAPDGQATFRTARRRLRARVRTRRCPASLGGGSVGDPLRRRRQGRPARTGSSPARTSTAPAARRRGAPGSRARSTRAA